jgi:triosephosphate isomerase
MKPTIRTPFFEIGLKNYIYGDTILEFAKAADAAAQKYDIDVLLITPYAEIRRVAENTNELIVLAPYMDTLRPGRGLADVLPEGLKAAGAKGVVVNHCEKPMSLSAIKATIDRARELNFIVFACADTIEEAKAIAQLHPDIINPEPSELIGGTGGVSDMSYVMESIKAIKSIFSDIMIEQAAGITNGQQVYDFIIAGSEAAGASSGIMKAKDPIAMIDEMVAATRRAANDLKMHDKKLKSSIVSKSNWKLS